MRTPYFLDIDRDPLRELRCLVVPLLLVYRSRPRIRARSTLTAHREVDRQHAACLGSRPTVLVDTGNSLQSRLSATTRRFFCRIMSGLRCEDTTCGQRSGENRRVYVLSCDALFPATDPEDPPARVASGPSRFWPSVRWGSPLGPPPWRGSETPVGSMMSLRASLFTLQRGGSWQSPNPTSARRLAEVCFIGRWSNERGRRSHQPLTANG